MSILPKAILVLIKNTKGSVTIYFMLFLSTLLLAESLLVQGIVQLDKHHRINQIIQSDLRSYFSRYNKQLSTYGLYAIERDSHKVEDIFSSYVQNNFIVSDAVKINLSKEEELMRQISIQMKYELTGNILKSIFSNFNKNLLSDKLQSASKIKNEMDQYESELNKYQLLFDDMRRVAERVLIHNHLNLNEEVAIELLITKVDKLYQFEKAFLEKYAQVFMLGDQLLFFRTILTEYLGTTINNKSQKVRLDLKNNAINTFNEILNSYSSKSMNVKKNESQYNSKILKETNKLNSILYSCKDVNDQITEVRFAKPFSLSKQAWSIMKTTSLVSFTDVEQVYLNEYIMHKLSNRININAFNTAHTYPHVSENSEVESIISGEQSCKASQLKVTLMIFNIRLAFHLMEELLSIKNQLSSVNPTVLFLSTVLKAVKDSVSDVNEIVRGNKVQLTKLIKFNFSLGYSEYLRLLLYIYPQKVNKLSRLRIILQKNTHTNFSDCITAVRINLSDKKTRTQKRFLFIDEDNYHAAFSY